MLPLIIFMLFCADTLARRQQRGAQRGARALRAQRAQAAAVQRGRVLARGASARACAMAQASARHASARMTAQPRAFIEPLFRLIRCHYFHVFRRYRVFDYA